MALFLALVVRDAALLLQQGAVDNSVAFGVLNLYNTESSLPRSLRKVLNSLITLLCVEHELYTVTVGWYNDTACSKTARRNKIE